MAKVKVYQKGGKVKRDPIYTNNKSKVQAYNDSLTLHKASLRDEKVLFSPEMNSAEKWQRYIHDNSDTPEEKASYLRLVKKIGVNLMPVGTKTKNLPFTSDEFKNLQTTPSAVYMYAEPTQPYIYQQPRVKEQYQQLPTSEPVQLPSSIGSYSPELMNIQIPHMGPNYIQEGTYGQPRVVNGQVDIPRQYQKGGKVKRIAPEDAAISNYLMQKNKGMNWVDRAYDYKNQPSIQNPDGSHSTHLMEWSFTPDQNAAIVYPNIVQLPNGQLENQGDEAQWNARQSGQYIQVPMNKAEMFSSYGYKHATGIPIHKNGGTMKRKVRILAAGGNIGDLRQRYNDQMNNPTESWNHNTAYRDPSVIPIQQDIQDLAAGKLGRLGQMAINTPAGISPVDGWKGTKTGAYSYRPLQYEYQHNGNIYDTYNAGTNYEQGIAQHQNRMAKQWGTGDWTANSQGMDVTGQQHNYNKYYQDNTTSPAVTPSGLPQNYTGVYEGKRYIGGVEDIPAAEWGGQLPNGSLDTRWNPYVYQGAYGINPKPDPYRLKNVIPEADEENSNPEDLIRIEKDEVVLQPNNGMIQAQKAATGSHESGRDKVVSVEPSSFILSDTKDLKIKDRDIQKEYGMKVKKHGYTPAQMATKHVNSLNKFVSQLSDPQTDSVSRKTAELMVGNYTGKLQKLASIQEQMKAAKGIAPSPDMMADGGPAGKNTNMMFNEDDQYWNNPTNETYVYAQRPQEKAGQPTGYQTLPTEITPMNVQPVSMPNNIQVNTEDSGNIGTIEQRPKGSREGITPFNENKYSTPDMVNMTNALANYAGIRKYLPWEPPVTGVIPQTVYMDDSRARAAIQEQAAQAYKALSHRRGNDLSKYLAIQGEAAPQVANVVAQYANQNNQIANQGNQKAAEITNALLEAQRNRSTRLHQGNTIAAQEYDNEERKARGELVNAYNNAWKNRAGYQNINSLQEHYKVDPGTGFIKFQTPEGQAEYMKMTSGQGASKFGNIDEVEKYLSNSPGLNEDDKSRLISKWIADNVFNMRDYTTRTTDARGRTTTKTKDAGAHQYGGKVRVKVSM